MMERLHRAGWSVGDAVYWDGGRLVWLVTGSDGEHLIHAEAATRREAWAEAVRQAEMMG